MQAMELSRWVVVDPSICNYDGQAPPGAEVGYFLQVRRAGHRTCGCLRSRQYLYLYMPHDPLDGEWPSHWRVMETYANSFFDRNPEYERTTASYGFLGIWRLYASLDFAPYSEHVEVPQIH